MRLNFLNDYFSHVAVPFTGAIAYLVFSKPFFDFVRKSCGITPKGGIQTLTICHSLFLAIYSLWTFVNMMKISLPWILKDGFYNAICDYQGVKWNQYNYDYWVFLFYLSKYYEFIDTWIVLLKGRDPIFLQTYHHAGIVVCMWGFVVTNNTLAGFITTTFNSFIHTIMYSYYVYAALGFKSSLKNYLTQAQITQFLVGIALTVPAFFMKGCLNPEQTWSLLAIHLYTYYLVYLFYEFYVTTYSKKTSKKLE